MDRSAYSTFTWSRRFLRYLSLLIGCPPRNSKKTRKGFVSCGSNQFFVSGILIATLCAIAATEASGDSPGHYSISVIFNRAVGIKTIRILLRQLGSPQASRLRYREPLLILICRNVSAAVTAASGQRSVFPPTWNNIHLSAMRAHRGTHCEGEFHDMDARPRVERCERWRPNTERDA
jgi:hypothetical protein